MTSLTRFIEGRLKLQVNAQKSAVARPWQRSFLGFTVTDEAQPRRRIADKALARFKDRVRGLTRRHRGVSLERMIADLNPLLRGWAGYFGFSQWRELASLDGWTRRRLRCVVWVQWKTHGRRYKELKRLNVSERMARTAVYSPKGPWRLSSSSALHLFVYLDRGHEYPPACVGSTVPRGHPQVRRPASRRRRSPGHRT